MDTESIVAKWVCIGVIGVAFTVALGKFADNSKLESRVKDLEDKVQFLLLNRK